MFEARLAQGSLLKRILESLKDLVTNANFECNSSGMTLQAMDSSHVSLVNMSLQSDGFEHYRADRYLTLGINLNALSKIMKCAGNDDSVTIRADDDGDQVSFIFMNQEGDRASEFSLKLIDIDAENLGIPEQEYQAEIFMPSSEFQRICRDLATIGETVSIRVNKEGVQFGVTGDDGSGSILLKQSGAIDSGKRKKKSKSEDEDEEGGASSGRAEESGGVRINLQEPMQANFALRYLNFFTKATPLSPQVVIRMSKQQPVAIEYKIESVGHVRYFLAPKIDDENPDDQDEAAEVAVPSNRRAKDEEDEDDISLVQQQSRGNTKSKPRVVKDEEGDDTQVMED